MSGLRRVFGAGSTPTSTIVRLVVVDVAAIMILILLGELRHGVDVLATPDRVLLTAVPFLLGWFVVAPLVGAYGNRALDNRRDCVPITLGAWLGGAGIGLVVRNTSYFLGSAPLSFALVMWALGSLTLVVARWIALPRLSG